MASKKNLYDAEFAPEALRTLKKRDILGRANWVQLVPLDYNLCTYAKDIEQKFQKERQRNPLIETTPPEAWIAAEIIPFMQEIRANANVDESVLSAMLQTYLRRHTSVKQTAQDSPEQQLCTTLEPYLPAIEALSLDVCDRGKSLRGILRLPRDAYTVREALRPLEPGRRREAILLKGIREKRRNHEIAKELHDQGLRPRLDAATGKPLKYGSYIEMLRINPQSFYAWKCSIKKKYSNGLTALQTERLN